MSCLSCGSTPVEPVLDLGATPGLLFVIGSLIMAYNLYKTAKGEIRESEPLDATAGRAPQGQFVAAPAH